MTGHPAQNRVVGVKLFVERFRPVPNHLDKTAGLDFGNGGCLFAAAGKQFRHVLAQSPQTIWTVVERDDGRRVIESGLGLTNHIGYLLTEKAALDGTRCVIVLEGPHQAA